MTEICRCQLGGRSC